MLLTGGTGTPEPQTQTVESGKEATFTVNSKEPTRTNYDFKGWSTDKNATTASCHGGESIKISKNTTLYAVWANPNPSESPAPSSGFSLGAGLSLGLGFAHTAYRVVFLLIFMLSPP